MFHSLYNIKYMIIIYLVFFHIIYQIKLIVFTETNRHIFFYKDNVLKIPRNFFKNGQIGDY